MCYYGDPAEVFKVSVRKARKDHRCTECSGRIPARSTYTYISCISEGSASSFKCHTVCYDLNEAIGNEMCGGSFVVGGELFESIREHYEECRGERRLDETRRMIVRGYAHVLRAQATA